MNGGGINLYSYPITRYMGFAIIVLAVLEVFNITTFKPLFLLGFSFSALLLTVVDLIEIKSDEKEDPFKYRKLKLGVLFSAICFFIIVPNLSIAVSDEIISKLNNIAVLLSIGLLFVIIGHKQEKVASDSLINIVDGMIEKAITENVDNVVEQTVDKMFEEKNLTETIKKTINEIEKNRY